MSQSNLITNDSDNHTTEKGVPVTRIRIDDLPVAENLTPEQEALIQGTGLKSFRPSLEVLEARDVPALVNPSVPGIDLTGTTLTITGSDYTAQQYSANVRINDAGQLVASRGWNGTPVTLNRADVKNIVFEGGAAFERFTNSTGIPSKFQNQESLDKHVQFSMTGPSILPNDSASGQTAVNGVPIGKNQAPDVQWQNLPPGTDRLGLTMKDPDAGPEYGEEGFTHMVLDNIPASARNLNEALAAGTLGVNGRGRREYYGPNPPGNDSHRYVYTLTAYDANGRVLGETQFTSRFAYAQGTQTDTGVNN